MDITEKIENGMYIRTRYGICQVKDYFSAYTILTDSSHGILTKFDILGEPSFNVLDVIKEGDYVDGYLINSKNDNGVYHGAYDCYDEAHFTKPEDVHTIVTKEQFAAMAYEVKHD